MYPHYKHVACISEATAAELIKWCPAVAEKISVIPNGIPLDAFETARPAALPLFCRPALSWFLSDVSISRKIMRLSSELYRTCRMLIFSSSEMDHCEVSFSRWLNPSV